MPLFTKEEVGLLRVEELRYIDGTEGSKKVKLDCVHPHLDFYLNCTYKMICGSFQEESQFNVWLTVTLDEKSSEQIQNYMRPCSIWGSVNAVNDRERFPLKKSSANQWNSEPLFVQFFRKEHKNELEKNFGLYNTLNCRIWMKFETPTAIFTSGERNFVQQMAELYVRQTNCDVQFIFEDNQKIGGHIAILSARSLVFAAMFQHNMKENQSGQIDIHDSKSVIFKQLLHYIYCGRLSTPLSEEDAQPLYVAADKYDIGSLKEECIQFLFSHIRVDNSVLLLVWAHLHSVDKIQEAVLDVIADNGKEICLVDDWANLMRNYPDLCLIATKRMMSKMRLIKPKPKIV